MRSCTYAAYLCIYTTICGLILFLPLFYAERYRDESTCKCYSEGSQMELFMEIFIVFFLGIHVYLLGLQDRISKQLRVMSLHDFGLLEPWNVFFQRLFLVLTLSLLNTLLILQVSRSFLFPLDFMLLGFPFPLYPPPPTPSQAQLSGVCGGVSPVPPVLSLSRSIKRRRTHAGRLKSPPTLPYGW